jgi:hypothetical protein
MLVQPTTAEYLDFHFAGTDARVSAPQRILSVLNQMLAPLSSTWVGLKSPIAIEIAFDEEVWRITGSSPSAGKALGRLTPLPQVAGAAISSLLAELAHHRAVSVWRATIVESQGNALAFVGDDWESCITLTAHLHARGWRILSGDYALVDIPTMTAIPFQKLLHVNSSSLSSFPLAYRRAVEASPWYSLAHTIAFYAIDPTLVTGTVAWAEQCVIRSILKVDGRIADHPTLEAAEDFAITETLRLSDLGVGLDSAMLIPGSFIETADFVERWFHTLSPCGS